MYPLAPGERVNVFCLLRSTQTCCFGPRPPGRPVPRRDRGTGPVQTQPPSAGVWPVPGRSAARSGVHLPHRGCDGRRGRGRGRPRRSAAARPPRSASRGGSGLRSPVSPGRLAAVPVLPPALTASDRRELVIDGFVVDRDPGPPAQFVVGSHPPRPARGTRSDPVRRRDRRARQRRGAAPGVAGAGGVAGPAGPRHTDPAAWNDQGIRPGRRREALFRRTGAGPAGLLRSCRRPSALPLALFLLLLVATVGRRPAAPLTLSPPRDQP